MSEFEEVEQGTVVSSESEPSVVTSAPEVVESSTETTQSTHEPESIDSTHESVTQDSAATQEGELPEFAKRRLGKQQKKHDREVAAMQQEMEMMRSHVAGVQQAPAQPQDPSKVFDPYTGQQVDVNSVQGQTIVTLNQQRQAEQMYNQQAQQSQKADAFNRQKQEIFNRFEDSLDDASEKYADFDDVVRSSSVPFTQDMAEIMAISPNPGDFAYYLGSNPKEVQRLAKLPSLQMLKEMNKHMVSMANKNVMSKAPEPVKGVEPSLSKPGSSFKNLTYEQMKAAKREQSRRGGRRKK